MKYLAPILFLFSAVILNAQMTMEEISYIPSPSGYYNNLIVKGNVFINELVTHPFNVQSYASVLDLEIPSSKIYINNLSVSTGTVALFSEFNMDEVNSWQIVVKETTGTNTTMKPLTNIYMNGGNLSLSSANSNNANLNIFAIDFGDEIEGKTPTLRAKTIDFQYNYSVTNNRLPVENLYIMGMKVPACSNYYWQPVSINSTSYTILACNNSNCTNPEEEESCLIRNYKWNTDGHPCECYDPNSHSVVPHVPINEITSL